MHIPWNLVRGSKPTYQGFLTLVDSLDLDVANRERTRLRLFQFFLNDQASKWLERLPAGSISTWEDLTTRESLSEAWTRFKDLLQKVPHRGIDLWIQDQALYENKSWNDPRDFAKPVKEISLPQDISNTSDCRLIELENQVQRLMEVHLALKKPVQVNKISSSCEIYSGPHDTKYCMENPEQAFVEYASSRSDEAGGEMPKKMEAGLFTLPCRLEDSKPFDTLVDLGSCVNIIPLYLFKKLKIGLLEESDHVFELTDGTKSYPVGIVRDVEVHIGKLKLLNDFYVIDMKKDPETTLLVGRRFLATANAVIDCKRAKIAVGKGITRSVFGVKEIDLGEEEAPYWTTLGKRESYKPRPSSDGIGAQTPYYARKEFMNCYFLGEWEIARDVEINPFKDVPVFRRMVEFLGALPINLKGNIW
ncbi:MAK10-like protein [Tanacetum coccineum]